jgi:hypothetical protein
MQWHMSDILTSWFIVSILQAGGRNSEDSENRNVGSGITCLRDTENYVGAELRGRRTSEAARAL